MHAVSGADRHGLPLPVGSTEYLVLRLAYCFPEEPSRSLLERHTAVLGTKYLYQVLPFAFPVENPTAFRELVCQSRYSVPSTQYWEW